MGVQSYNSIVQIYISTSFTDFVFHRSPCYLRKMYTRSVQILSHIFTSGFTGKLITDTEIVNFFIQTGACQHLKYDATKNMVMKVPHFFSVVLSSLIRIL